MILGCLSDSLPNVSWPPTANELCHVEGRVSLRPLLYPYAEHQALHSVDSPQRCVWRMNSE